MVKMTPMQVRQIERALEALQRDVVALLHNGMGDAHEGSFRELAGEVHDTADEAVADEMMSIDGALAERHGNELLAIERARARLAAGALGECAECGDEIGLPRLLANPVAERCIRCEAQRERTYAHAATPRL